MSTKKEKVSTTQKYKKQVRSMTSMLPNVKIQKYKGSTFNPETYVSNYTPGVYENNYTPTQFNGSYSPGTYDSKYLPQIEEALGNITNWSYDPLQDASYQALAKVYGARGNVAAKNSLADAAALNGGYGSSYAVSAAQQARNQYNQELASFIPQLEQASYERQQAGYNALMDLDNALYGRFSDDESRRLQAAQFALDVAGFNEANNQYAADRDFNIFTNNEANRQYAEDLGLRIHDINTQNQLAKAGFDLDVFNANTDSYYRGKGLAMDRITTGADLLGSKTAWAATLNGNKKTGTTGGRGRGSSGSGISGYNGASTTADTYTKATTIAADKKKGNKKVNKGTLNGNTLQYR